MFDSCPEPFYWDDEHEAYEAERWQPEWQELPFIEAYEEKEFEQLLRDDLESHWAATKSQGERELLSC